MNFDRLRWHLNTTINYEIGHCRHTHNSGVWGISGWFFPGRHFVFVANMYRLYGVRDHHWNQKISKSGISCYGGAI